MKSMSYLFLALSVVLLQSGCACVDAPKRDEPFPGLFLYRGEEALYGKLAVCITRIDGSLKDTREMSTIYDVNLATGQWKEIAKTPSGQFAASIEGDIYSVVSSSASPDGRPRATNVFVVVPALGIERRVSLAAEPCGVVSAKGHVLFIFSSAYSWQPDCYHATNCIPVEYSLLDYNPIADKATSSWYFQSLDQWESYRSHVYGRQAFDGRYIFFMGRDGPLDGTTLVSSSRDHDEQSAFLSDSRVLSRFGNLIAVPGATSCELRQLSPDRRYALVRVMSTEVTTYFAVELATGRKRELLQIDNSKFRKNEFFIVQVMWVRNGNPPETNKMPAFVTPNVK